jgi:protein-S-isoprenylcysteine O-methyltransferase Ste14
MSREKREGILSQHSHHEYGQSWMIAAALLHGPLTYEELLEYFRVMGRRFGMFLDVFERSRDSEGINSGGNTRLQESLENNLEQLLNSDWIVRDEDRYLLTEKGREEAEKMLEELKRSGRVLDTITRPETVSKVTMIIHFVLGAIKLPAALLSGSVGLLNDALDTLMDGISSLFVFFGVKRNKERLASYILLIFMTATGLFTLYEAVTHFIRPEPLVPEVLTFVAVIVSAGLCALLWFYQKYSGLKHNCVPLIAQSIDSRNHIIVAGGVGVALIASLLHFPLLDHIVGVLVAVLILKGAVELLLDVIRSSGDGEIDLSRYGFQRFEKHRQVQFLRWLLFEIDKGRVSSREDMEREARIATDFTRVEPLQVLGLAEQSNRDTMIESAIHTIFEQELAQGHPLRLTEKGKQALDKALSSAWKFSQSHSPLGTHPLWVRIVGKLFMVVFSAALFTGVWALAHFLLDFLPDYYAWSGFPVLISLSSFSFTLPRIGFVGAGFLLFFFGRRLTHKSRRILSKSLGHEERSEPVFLVTSGPYAKRRHPLYAGSMLTAVGLAIAIGSLYVLALVAVFLIVRLIMLIPEERRLLECFGDTYRSYTKNVPLRLYRWYTWAVVILVLGASWVGLFL